MRKYLLAGMLLLSLSAFACPNCQCKECRRQVIENPECPYCGAEVYYWSCPNGHGQGTEPGPRDPSDRD
jgi:hypothetical protein